MEHKPGLKKAIDSLENFTNFSKTDSYPTFFNNVNNQKEKLSIYSDITISLNDSNPLSPLTDNFNIDEDGCYHFSNTIFTVSLGKKHLK